MSHFDRSSSWTKYIRNGQTDDGQRTDGSRAVDGCSIAVARK